VLQAGSNLGFSAGCNIGIRHALAGGADAVLLVNSDVVLAPDTVARLVAALHARPDVGIVGPVLLSRAEPDGIASAGMTFRPATGRMRHRFAGRRVSALPSGAVRVDAVSGCVMLVRRDVFERAGFFDEEYFFYYEDLDLCTRASRAGFETLCVPGAMAYHEGAATIGPRSATRVYYGVRNHLRVAERLFPGSAVATMGRRAAILAFSAAYVALSPEVGLVSGLAAAGRGALDHLRGRYGPSRV
jgi:hypothetical protein